MMKLSSSEALAIQKASAPAMFFCFCKVPITATHRERKKTHGRRLLEQQDEGETEKLKRRQERGFCLSGSQKEQLLL